MIRVAYCNGHSLENFKYAEIVAGKHVARHHEVLARARFSVQALAAKLLLEHKM